MDPWFFPYHKEIYNCTLKNIPFKSVRTQTYYERVNKASNNAFDLKKTTEEFFNNC